MTPATFTEKVVNPASVSHLLSPDTGHIYLKKLLTLHRLVICFLMTPVTFTEIVVNPYITWSSAASLHWSHWLEMKSDPAWNYVHGVASTESTTLTESLIRISDSLSCLNVLMNNLTWTVLLNTSHTSLHYLHNYAASDSPKITKTITVTIYFINPSGKLKLSFDRTTKNIS